MSAYIQEHYGKYAEASFVGAARALVGLPIEHPLDVIKTQSQACLEERSSWKITKRIYETHGIHGFFSGAIPNAFRLAGKHAYRYPMMLGFPGFFKDHLPADFQQKFPDAVRAVTGLTIASCETFLVCPPERLKVFLITNNIKTKQLRHFFKTNKYKLRTELFRGIGTVYARQISAWVSFLISDKRMKDLERKRTGKQQLPISSLIKVSVVVGAFNALVNMPFDVAKTNLQKHQHLENEGLWKTLSKIYHMHGVHGLYAGWKPKVIQYMLQSAMTVTLLDRLENSWSQK